MPDPEKEGTDKPVAISFGDKSITLALPAWVRGMIGALLVTAGLAALVFGSMYVMDAGPFAKGKIKFDRAVAEQMVMANRYLAQTPDSDVVVGTDPDGKSSVRHYRDGNLYAYKTPNDPATRPRGFFVNLRGERLTPLDENGEMTIGGTLSSPLFADTDPARCAAMFAEQAHPGEPKVWSEPIDSCNGRIRRLYEDGCENYQNCNCQSGCDPYPTWSRCQH